MSKFDTEQMQREAQAAAPPSPGAGLSEADQLEFYSQGLNDAFVAQRWTDVQNIASHLLGMAGAARRLGATNAEAVGFDAEGLADDLERALIKIGRLTTPHPYVVEARHFIESARRRLETPPTGTRGVSEAMVERACVAAYNAMDMGLFPHCAVNPKADRDFVRAALESLSAATSGGENG